MTILEQKRKEEGLTQNDMANAINSSVGGYNMYENNQRKIPNNKAKIIAETLKCNIDDIFVPSNFTASEKQVKEV